jgi:hypothetical protein
MAEEQILDPEELRRRAMGAPSPVAPPTNDMPSPAGSAVPMAIPKASVPVPSTSIPAVSVPKIGPAQTELNRLESTGSGVSQIKNPWLHGLAKVGDVLGTIAAPRIAAAIPGTTIHHNLQVARQEGLANEEAGYAEKQAQAGHVNAETSALQNPPDKPASNDVELFQQDPAQYEKFLNAKAENTPDKAVNPEREVFDYMTKTLGMRPDEAYKQLKTSGAQPKEPNRDDRAIAINQKVAMGQQLTPDEIAYKKAYDQYVKQNKVDPGVQRMQILVNGKPIDVVDPNNQQNVIPMRTGEAIASHASRPQSIPFQAEAGVTRAFTSGRPAEELNAFNTAIAHADLLGQAATALGNGDVRAINSLKNNAKTAFGSADVTNFGVIAKIYTGEVTKAINAGHVTEGELESVGATIPNNASPQQIAGAVNAFRKLMQSKVQQRQNQYEQGMQGKPNFGTQGDAVEEYIRDANGKLVRKQ